MNTVSNGASPKEGGRLGTLRREAPPIISQLIGNSFRVQGLTRYPDMSGQTGL